MFDFLSTIYREKRHLESVPEKQFHDRLRGLVYHLTQQEFSRLPELVADNNEAGIAFVEVLEEARLRGHDPLRSVKEHLEILHSDVPHLESSHALRALLTSIDGPCLFKYTKAKYASQITEGRIRLTPASRYNDPRLVAAIRDDEISISHRLPGLRITTQAGDQIPVRDGVISSSAASNYYISCFATVLSPKLFRLFDATACVAIPNPSVFLAAVRKEHAEQLPNFVLRCQPVAYIDQFKRLGGSRPIEFRKPYEFLYESEYRVASIPRFPDESLDEVVTLELNPATVGALVVRVSW